MFDELVELHNVTWEDYERIASLRGESAIPRLTYEDGVLELMSPGQPHEIDKKRLARLFEAYLEELGIDADGVGSWTVRQKKKKRGAEPDECYVFDPIPVTDKVKCPDLVIEVIYRRGGLNKLAIWRALGAKEVWFWTKDQQLLIYVRRDDKMVESARSALVPAVDPALLVRCMRVPGQTAALRALRDAIRKRRKR